jgi:hypothetical protein
VLFHRTGSFLAASADAELKLAALPREQHRLVTGEPAEMLGARAWPSRAEREQDKGG